MKRISIDPITRLEGHGKIDIFLDDQGDVANCYLQIPELRGFEKFCVGRPVEEMPNLTERICGVCPEAHHMAATKALDAVFHVDPPPAAKKLRELFYSIFFATDHTTHFYALGGPDFVVGPQAPPAERNLIGVINKVGMDIAGKVLKMRRDGHKLIKMMGGRAVHPNWGLPGGVSCGLNEEKRAEIEKLGRDAIEFAKFSLKIFNDVVLANSDYVNLIKSDMYTHRTYNMGTVDQNNHVNFYDGKIRVVGPDGKERFKYEAKDYQQYVAERVEPWSYLKFPYLKKVGWKGFVDGPESGVYRATPLVASQRRRRDGHSAGSAGVRAILRDLGRQAACSRPWPRTGRDSSNCCMPPRTGCVWPPIRRSPAASIACCRPQTPTEGVGCVEAPRGTLTHHYATDERGIVTKVNLIVGTTNNNAPICMSVKKAAQGLIKKGEVTEGLLNMVEMAFRAYDPCFGCATHSLPGQMPLEVRLRDPQGNLVRRLTQYVD